MASAALTLGPPGFTQAWWFGANGAIHNWHRHNELELSLVGAGSARYLVRDQSWHLNPGDLVFLFPEHDHVLVDTSPDFGMWIAVIDVNLLRPAARDPAFSTLLQGDPAEDTVRRATRSDARTIDGLFREAAQATNAAQTALTTALFITAWNAYQRAASGTAVLVHPAVERAAAAISADPSADCEAIARQAGLSQSRLSRLFHQQLGETMVQFRTRARLLYFQDLRERNPNATLLALALQAGFGSYAQFHRAVHRIVGCKPANWHQGRFAE
ncbi:MAG: AraC family transcriptional regulator [Planctomycetota bacterium]|jgi:AraC-like DNA-binding protein|nr:AraC family transcriptional regulator [Planctomycetota bacterium]